MQTRIELTNELSTLAIMAKYQVALLSRVLLVKTWNICRKIGSRTTIIVLIETPRSSNMKIVTIELVIVRHHIRRIARLCIPYNRPSSISRDKCVSLNYITSFFIVI